MDNTKDKASKALQRLLINLQILGIYIKPHKYYRLLGVHVVYCWSIIIYAAVTVIRGILPMLLDEKLRGLDKVSWILNTVNTFLLLGGINICYKRVEIVVKNCNDILKSNSLSMKAKMKFITLCHVTQGYIIIVTIFVFLFITISIIFGLMDDDDMLFALYPIDITQLSRTAYYSITVILFTVTLICKSAAMALPWFSMCISFIETQLFRNLNIKVEEVVKMINSPNEDTASDLEDLRHRHLHLIKMVEQHNDMIKFPIAVIFASIIIDACIALYIVASASGFIDLTTVVLQLGFGFINASVIFWSGIRLNNEVSVLFLRTSLYKYTFYY